MYKALIAALAALLLIGMPGVARAEPATDSLRVRVEDELLSDGISLPRLGQRLELHARGTALDVVLVDPATGTAIASRAVDKLPADPGAAVAQLTVVVSELLRERGILPASVVPSWTATFTPAAVIAYHRPSSIAVVAVASAGQAGEQARAAAAALTAAYRSAGVVTVKDGGALPEADDAAIVGQSGALQVGAIAIVRVFIERPTARAIVTLYSASNQLITGFSAVAGQALTTPAPGAAPGSDTVADQLMRTRAAAAEPALDKDGVVRLWMPHNPQLQLLRTQLIQGANLSVGLSRIVCRAPCGVVVDGSLGEEFTVGEREEPLIRPFQLVGHHGDVTIDFKRKNRGLEIGANYLSLFSLLATIGGALLVAEDTRSNTGKLLIGGGVGGFVGCYFMWRGARPEIALTPGRPQ
jgi:hypothetical protein